MAEPGRPRRPLHFGPDAMEAHGGSLPDPAETAEAAHAAWGIVSISVQRVVRVFLWIYDPHQ